MGNYIQNPNRIRNHHNQNSQQLRHHNRSNQTANGGTVYEPDNNYDYPDEDDDEEVNGGAAGGGENTDKDKSKRMATSLTNSLNKIVSLGTNNKNQSSSSSVNCQKSSSNDCGTTVTKSSFVTIKSSSSALSNVRSSVCKDNPKYSTMTRSSQSASSKKTTVSSGGSSNSNPLEDSEVEKLRLELREAKRQVYEREQQLLKLHREVHKLRSVLEHSDAISAIKPSLSMTMLLADGSKHSLPNKKQGVSGESYGSVQSLGDPMQNINFVWKDFDCRRIIQDALLDNSFLKNYLNQEQLDLIVDSMYDKEFARGCYICRRGTYGCHLYVITYGHCEVIDAHDKSVNQMGPGKAFGELALLYNCTRTASVKTLTRVRTWVLDRKVFQMIMMKTCLDRTQSIKQFLKSVPLLNHLNEEKISKIADVVEVDYYPRGDYICRQGSLGDSFYIISKGTVRVTRIKEQPQPHPQAHTQNGTVICSSGGIILAPVVKEETIRMLTIRDYFGEQALLLGLNASDLSGTGPRTTVNGNSTNSVRTANVISEDCECLVLDQVSFFTLLGDLNEIRSKSYSDQPEETEEPDSKTASVSGTGANLSAPSSKSILDNKLERQGSNTSTNSCFTESKADPFLLKLTLDDLERIDQLGMGGFGIVNLVRAKSNPSRVFALKRCSKEFIRTSHQQQHIVNEKLVMQHVSGRHQFVVALFRTFSDTKNVYFLMETVLGGELWTVLRKKGPFSESASRFYLGCVIEALQFLHLNNIIYRDLKPENCLLDSAGYLKLTDFGFSKFIQRGEKTWTFCGTPEYVAPEIVLNRGHDRAVDIWSIGILLYELLTGIPPFTSADPLQTYHIILRGFDSIGFDEKTFSKHSVSLIRNLCRENPNERLGIRGRNGFNDIKRHKWFSGFNWNHLIARKLAPPIVPKLSSATDTRNFDTAEMQNGTLNPGSPYFGSSQNNSQNSPNNNSHHNHPSNKSDKSSSSLSPKPSSLSNSSRQPLLTPGEQPQSQSQSQQQTSTKSHSQHSDEKYSPSKSNIDFNNNWESYF